MRAADRIALTGKIARELQSRYTYADIDIFFNAVGIDHTAFSGQWDSKYVYSKAVLANISNEELHRVAHELDMETLLGSGGVPVTPPKNWQGSTLFRLFISHISKDKIKATRLKECLERFQIIGFVAHEDIHPTLEWQTEIERGLSTMDAFISIHTRGFSASNYTQQELGFAMGRGSKIICFEMGEQPTGFASKHQSLPRRLRTAEQIAEEVNGLLMADSRTQSRLKEAQMPAASQDLLDDIPF